MCVMTAPVEGTMGSVALVASALGQGGRKRRNSKSPALTLSVRKTFVRCMQATFESDFLRWWHL